MFERFSVIIAVSALIGCGSDSSSGQAAQTTPAGSASGTALAPTRDWQGNTASGPNDTAAAGAASTDVTPASDPANQQPSAAVPTQPSAAQPVQPGAAQPVPTPASDPSVTPVPPGAAAAPTTPASPTTPPSGLPDVDFAFDTVVPAGAELLRCTYGVFPSDRGVIAAPGAESHYTPGSHHMLAYRTNLKTAPMEGVHDCQDGAGSSMVTGSYYEAQQPDSMRSLPPGIAHEFQPGEILLLQAHYINTTSGDVNAHVELRIHTMNLADVTQEAGSIMFNNGNISVAPHAKSRSSMTCTLPSDFNPALLWSHMHSRGIHFEATTDDTAAAAALGTLYTNDDWSEPQPRDYPFDPPVVLHANSHITFSCDFQNDTDQTFTFGQSAATNEMCILHGMYWPRMATSGEQCLGGKSTRTAL
jgi:hypothetical protein